MRVIPAVRSAMGGGEPFASAPAAAGTVIIRRGSDTASFFMGHLESGRPVLAKTGRGSRGSIDEAARKATRHMIDYLVAERGLTRGDAQALASLAGDLKIDEVVDVPHVLVSMHMPKGVVR
jgi:acetamidase/formamidase